MGEYAKAEPLEKKALLASGKRSLGLEHLDTAIRASMVWPSCTEDMGEYSKAEPLYQEALRIRQKVLGR